MVRFAADTGLPGYELYDQTDEVGQTGVFVGYGMSGTGDTVLDGGADGQPLVSISHARVRRVWLCE